MPKPRGYGGYISLIIWLYPLPPSNLSMVYICIHPPIIWPWSTSTRRSPLEFGKKVFHFWWRPLFLIFIWIREKKVFHFRWRPFIFYFIFIFLFGFFFICSLEKHRGRGSSPNVENRAKIANYPPNAQQKSATLVVVKWNWSWTLRSEIELYWV